MNVDGIDHIVLTVADIDVTCNFYVTVLGMTIETFEKDRTALSFGNQKLNVQSTHKASLRRALRPTPGSVDVCFVTSMPMDDVIRHLTSCGVTILEGPVGRTGARGPMMSIYLHDPDKNLIEVASYQTSA